MATIQLLRNRLNKGKVKRKVLRKYPPELIIGALKLYLMELPISVCTDEMYDALKLLYLSKAEDAGDMRLNSLRNLLATLPSTYFHTLSFLASHWSALVSKLKPNDSRIAELSNVLGPYVLRPRFETALSVHDKHRSRLVRDLILHQSEILTSVISPEMSSENVTSTHASLEAATSMATLDSDDESDDDSSERADENASTRAIYDGTNSFVHGMKSASSISSSLASYKTKKTGYSLTVNSYTESIENLGTLSASATTNSGAPSNGIHSNNSNTQRKASQDSAAVVASDVIKAARQVGSSWLLQASEFSSKFTASMTQPSSSSLSAYAQNSGNSIENADNTHHQPEKIFDVLDEEETSE